MGVGALRTTLDQRLRRLICLTEFTSLNAVADQLSSGNDPIWVELYGACQGFVGPLEHRLPTVGIVRIVVATHSKLFPCRRVGWVDVDHMLQNRDCVFVQPGIVRQREAMQVEVVGLRIFRTRASIEETT